MLGALFSFLHFLAAFGVVATVVVEWVALTESPTYREARLLQISDRWYGAFAGIVLVAGFLRVIFFEKGSAFYFSSPFFYAKLGLFVMVGLLSIYPTVRFLMWRSQMATGSPPILTSVEYKTIRAVLRLEVVLLVGVVLCAAFMARGVSP
jgi:putative membrane protein